MIYLVRHGQTIWNAEGRVQGSLDSPLTELGVRQMQAVGQYLAEVDKLLPFCYSDLGRVLESVSIISTQLPYDPPRFNTALLRERNHGEWEGHKSSELDDLFDRSDYQENKFFYDKYGVESYYNVYRRLEQLIGMIGVGDHYVIVSHQTINAVLMAMFTESETIDEFKVSNSEIMTFDPETGEVGHITTL